MSSFPEIQTERLRLRRFRPEDTQAFLAYRNDPEVTRYDGVDGVDENRARAFIAEQALISPGKPGVWLQIAVELRGDGLIGDCGFRVNEENPHTAEIGYRLHRNRWGNGYAFEATTAVLDWAFGPLGLHRVVALIDTRNSRSIDLVERLGFRREGVFVESYLEPEGWSDEYLFALLEREWRARLIPGA